MGLAYCLPWSAWKRLSIQDINNWTTGAGRQGCMRRGVVYTCINVYGLNKSSFVCLANINITPLKVLKPFVLSYEDIFLARDLNNRTRILN